MYKPFPFYFPTSPFPLFFKTILFQVFLFINLQTLLKKGKKGKWGNKRGSNLYIYLGKYKIKLKQLKEIISCIYI